MRLARDPTVHFTYCTNVHPGETWAELRENLRTHVVAVKRVVCRDQPFCVGLRVSGRAAAELASDDALSELRALLASEGLYAVTINGFPHGAFHGQAVKERVYLPDWRSEDRLLYSNRLARLLAALLPHDVDYGSVSTVPGAYKAALAGPDDIRAMVDNLLRHVAFLAQLRDETGRRVVLALEPEPCCFLETIQETVAFFEGALRSDRSVTRLAEWLGASRHRAQEALQAHLGVCLDACHAAVEFESSEEVVDTLDLADIQVAKLQLSSALRIERMTMATREALIPFLDEVYLHQVVERADGQLTRYADLPEALEHHGWQRRDTEWRIHFHVPVFVERLKRFTSTQSFLKELLALQRRKTISHHLEVETYTWDVLPAELCETNLTSAIAQEMRFCLTELG